MMIRASCLRPGHWAPEGERRPGEWWVPPRPTVGRWLGAGFSGSRRHSIQDYLSYLWALHMRQRAKGPAAR